MRRGSVEAFALQAVGAGLLFLMHTVLARAARLGDYGVFSYAQSLAIILAVLVPLGWPTALMRFTAQYLEQQRWGLLRGVVQRAYQVTLLSAVLVALVMLLVSHAGFLSSETSTGLRYAALLLPPLAFVGLRRNALQGLKRYKTSIFPEQILLPSLVTSGVLLSGVHSAFGIVLAYAGAAFVVFMLSNAWLWRSIPLEARAAKPEFETRAWTVVAVPMIFGGIGQLATSQVGTIVLGALSEPEEVGVYSAAVRLATLNVFVLNAVSTVAASMMAAAFHGGRLQQTDRILRQSMLLSAVGALPLFAFMLLFPHFLLGLFGPEFARGALVLRTLAVGQFANAATGPVSFVLLMTGRERTFAWIMGSTAVCLVVGCLLVVPAYGAAGAAAVTAASIAGANVCQYLFYKRAVGNTPVR